MGFNKGWVHWTSMSSIENKENWILYNCLKKENKFRDFMPWYFNRVRKKMKKKA